MYLYTTFENGLQEPHAASEKYKAISAKITIKMA